jgi:acyl-CoA reductase-like NAD-dependent aldehyde dehydrogenase
VALGKFADLAVVGALLVINAVLSFMQDQVNSPFGGERNSGLGRFGGDWVLEELTRVHWISIQHRPRQYPF